LRFTENWHEWSFALSPEGDEVLLETGRFEGSDLFVLDLEEKSAVRMTDTPEREMSVAWNRHRSDHLHAKDR
jgi:Tol biopolymer transport system component